VIFVLKAGDNGLRPIALMSCFLKLFEKMVYRRLSWFIETQLEKLPPGIPGRFPELTFLRGQLSHSNQSHTSEIFKESLYCCSLPGYSWSVR